MPASSELALGGLLAAGHGSPILLFLVATGGNVLGSVANFYAGMFAARFAGRRWFLSERQLEAASGWFERRGSWLLLFAWLPVAGDPLTVVAGMLRVPFFKFLVLVTIGKAARYGVLVAGFGWFQA
ncbi:YqaA family protein [Terrihabitans rhizophilus]|uniref:VTT domain-containing protein n=1 Tax=Terrihabitans rhizophilus TaxID=3092662 RepID=A0ABU4RRW6_9HYPH|nr:VTT domain-containing protein [Terrihabitans sp. PJ23]MDX6807589.1 VTT domain-containing protein [Terrihabitans sp. PJ23]